MVRGNGIRARVWRAARPSLAEPGGGSRFSASGLPARGNAGIVGAEILQKFTPKLKPGYGPGQADIDYEVLFVSPSASKPAKAADADWQRVGRLNQLYLHHKHLSPHYRRKLQTADMAGLSAQMNNLYAGMMKGMAAEASRRKGQWQRALTGQ